MFIVYLADTSSLINLVKSKAAVRLSFLTRLVQGGRLRVPDAVADELSECNDDLKGWANRHRRRWVKSNDQNTQGLEDVCRTYSRYLMRQDKKSRADAVVVCMAIHYSASPWVVLADDGGIQAVCVLLGLPYSTSKAFRMLEGL